MPTSPPPLVTVLGLGAMGASLASALLRTGAVVTVWNRTPGRAAALVERGAIESRDLGAAVADADLVLVCVRDHTAARELLTTAAPRLRPGADVVNLSSATAAEARASGEWAVRHRLSYLSGAILATTSLIGSAEALILYSGPAAIFARHHDLLLGLAGRSVHLGEDHGRAAAHDIAMLGIFFAGMTSFLHAAALIAAEDVPARTFLPYAQDVLDVLGSTLPDLARDVDAGRYPGTEDTLAMQRAFLAHIVQTSTAAGVDPALPSLMLDYTRRAVDAGHGQDGFARIVDLLRVRV